MFDTILGLPLHPLVVHATVIVVPAAAIAVVLAGVWPWFRRWAGLLPVLLAAAAVLLVPVTTSSGEALERLLPRTPLLERHTQLADGLLVPVLVVGVAALALAWVYLREQVEEAPTGRIAMTVDRVGGISRLGGQGRPGRAVLAVVIVIAVASSVFTLVQVARIGHSGAEAAWSGIPS